MEHTPKPWKLDSIYPDGDGYKIRGGSLVFRKGPRLIAVVKNQGDRPIAEDSLSDARLIAQAPVMYDTLNAALAAITNPQAFDLDQVRANISAVLLAAKGGA